MQAQFCFVIQIHEVIIKQAIDLKQPWQQAPMAGIYDMLC